MNGSLCFARPGPRALWLSFAFIVGCSPTAGELDAAEPSLPVVSLETPVPAAPAAPATGDCCSCASVAGETFTDPRLPCQFDFPGRWEAVVGNDGALVSAVAGPRSCGIACPNGTPATAISFATRSDSNAESMESVWRTAMPIVGNARCGEGTINFYSPPGADEMGFLGGVKFYVSIGGEKYSGAATFSCGEPGGWLRQRDMFVDSFRDNPGSTFPE